jgi:two-component system sensor histidine kinase YesM
MSGNMDDGVNNISQKISKRKFSSIFMKNLFLLSIVIFLPMSIVIWVATFSFHAFTEKEIDIYSNKSLAMVNTITSDMLKDCLQQMIYLSANTDVTAFLISGQDQEAVFYDTKSLFTLLTVQLRTKEYLSSIYIYSEKNDMVLSNYGLTEKDNFFDMDWYDEYRSNEKPGRFWCAFRNGTSAFQKPARILSLYKSIGITNRQDGILVFNINYDKFIQQISAMHSSYDAGLFIADRELNVLDDVWGNHDNFPLEGIHLLFDLTADNMEKDYVRLDDYVLYKSPIQYTDWNYLYAVPNETYISKTNVLLKDMVLVIICGFLITIIVTVIISNHIYQPYRRILNTLQEPASFINMEQKISNREENFILSTIKNTIKENAAITQELKERVDLLKRSQSIALQSQINPHFLYNTLDTINWSAMRLTGGKNETSTMISRLANMIRYSLDSVDNLVPLEKEVGNIRTYLDLQGLRYKDKFSVIWDVDEEILKCKVLKIMLQPIVENAIYHGVKPLPVDGTIWIIAKKIDETLTIVISDNGVGMDHHLVKQINEAMQSRKIEEKEHLGIMNVNQRIRLFFGDQFGITLESEENRGTTVIINMPYILE